MSEKGDDVCSRHGTQNLDAATAQDRERQGRDTDRPSHPTSSGHSTPLISLATSA